MAPICVGSRLSLDEVDIIEAKPSGLMDRCCIDLAEKLEIGEGILTGMVSRGLFLVHGETVEQKWTAIRPFRVNAGPVSAYVLLPEKKRKYLSEIKGGQMVLAVDHKGNTREIEVARNKMESRPALLVRAHSDKLEKIIEKTPALKKCWEAMRVPKGEFHAFLQNAETLMLVDKRGKPVRANLLKKGDKVLAWVENPKVIGTHFGIAVKETILEQ